MGLEFEQALVEIEERIAALEKAAPEPSAEAAAEIASLRDKLHKQAAKIYSELTPWQTVQVARHPNRPLLKDYIKGVFSEFIELHGDRCFGDDQALLGGFATVGKHRCMLIGMDKGKTVEDKVKANFGMANPEGYRKALRLMRLAEKYRLPVVCLVDTPAAYPGKDAEERGQAEAIARNLTEMATLETPIVVIITGEGGSGGALGIAVGDAVMMLRYAIYSVIPPEGCAAILWRDAEKAADAAEALKITAPSLLDLKIIDEIIEEPAGGAHRDHEGTFAAVGAALMRNLARLNKVAMRKLLERRYEKYARIGKFDKRKHAAY